MESLDDLLEEIEILKEDIGDLMRAQIELYDRIEALENRE